MAKYDALREYLRSMPGGRTVAVNTFRLPGMCPTVRTEDLIDAWEVARVIGLSHPNSVSTCQHHYSEMPRPVVDLGRGRLRLWLRPEIERGARLTGRID